MPRMADPCLRFRARQEASRRRHRSLSQRTSGRRPTRPVGSRPLLSGNRQRPMATAAVDRDACGSCVPDGGVRYEDCRAYPTAERAADRNIVRRWSSSSGSSLSRRRTVIGARIRIAFSPLRTQRLSFRNARNPATKVASGFCRAISSWLFSVLSCRLGGVVDVVVAVGMTSDPTLTFGDVIGVVDVVVRGRSDAASRRRAESQRPRRARSGGPPAMPAGGAR